jgi:hypothetical protein
MNSPKLRLSDPNLVAWSILFAESKCEFRVADQASLQEQSFHDGRLALSGALNGGTAKVDLETLISLVEQKHRAGGLSPARFIFHVGHCGSTLLSRVLAQSPKILAHREPYILGGMSDTLRDIDSATAWVRQDTWLQILRTVVYLLGRTDEPYEQAVVKVKSGQTNLAMPLLGLDKRIRAIGLYVPLERFLAGALRDDGRTTDAAIFVPHKLRDWIEISGTTVLKVADLTTVQRIGVCWLSSMAQMIAVAERFPDRLMLVNFEEFLRDPPRSIDGVLSHMHLGGEKSEILAGYREVASSHSKEPDKKFDRASRERLLIESRERNSDRIEAGLKFIEQHLQKHGGRYAEPVRRHLACL